MKLSQRLWLLLEKLNKTSLPDKYANNDVAMSIIKAEINNMLYEIKSSQKGSRGQIGFGKDAIRIDQKSTFPKYLQDIFNGQGTTKKFEDVVKRGFGKVWDRIALIAIDRLENGYRNEHGYDTPDKDFIDVVNNPVPF